MRGNKNVTILKNMPFAVQYCACNFVLQIRTIYNKYKKQTENNKHSNNLIKETKMRKLRRIIKDIVKQQIEFAQQNEKGSNKEFIRQLTYKQLIITDDGVGRH